MPESSPWRKIVESRWFIIGGVVILILLSFAYARAWYQEYQIQAEISHLEDEADKLEAKKIKIQEQLEYVRSSAYIESKARTELNLAKEGEHMIVVDHLVQKALDQRAAPVIQYAQVSNPLKWLHYFIH